jgi:hypothetical protein
VNERDFIWKRVLKSVFLIICKNLAA